jgi:hypothetical protein
VRSSARSRGCSSVSPVYCWGHQSVSYPASICLSDYSKLDASGIRNDITRRTKNRECRYVGPAQRQQKDRLAQQQATCEKLPSSGAFVEAADHEDPDIESHVRVGEDDRCREQLGSGHTRTSRPRDLSFERHRPYRLLEPDLLV